MYTVLKQIYAHSFLKYWNNMKYMYLFTYNCRWVVNKWHHGNWRNTPFFYSGMYDYNIQNYSSVTVPYLQHLNSGSWWYIWDEFQLLTSNKRLFIHWKDIYSIQREFLWVLLIFLSFVLRLTLIFLLSSVAHFRSFNVP